MVRIQDGEDGEDGEGTYMFNSYTSAHILQYQLPACYFQGNNVSRCYSIGATRSLAIIFTFTELEEIIS